MKLKAFLNNFKDLFSLRSESASLMTQVFGKGELHPFWLSGTANYHS